MSILGGLASIVAPNTSFAQAQTERRDVKTLDSTLDAGDVRIANWVKEGKNQTREQKYKLDYKGNEHPIGIVAFYERVIEIDGNKWCMIYADNGPIQKKDGLFSADGTPNNYDALTYELCNKPVEERMKKDDVSFRNIGLNGILYSAHLESGNFWNPNSKAFEEHFSYRGTDKIRLEEEKRMKDSHIQGFEEGQRRYNLLRQKILQRISEN